MFEHKACSLSRILIGTQSSLSPIYPSFFFFPEENLIPQASLVRTGISGQSDRFDSQDASAGRRNKSVDIELTSFHPFSQPIHTLAPRNIAAFFVRTYNKLKSHHPRDLDAITRPSSLEGGRSCAASKPP